VTIRVSPFLRLETPHKTSSQKARDIATNSCHFQNYLGSHPVLVI
jgi:hypothetical protein